MKKFLLKFFFGLVILPGLIIGVFYSLENHGFFNIDHVELAVEEAPASSAYLQPLLKKLNARLDVYQGVSLWKIDLPRVSSEISALDWVDDVTISRRFPSKIRITVRPKEVKFLFFGGGGRLVPVVTDGSFLEPVDPRLAPDVPLLIGENFAQKSELRKKSVKVFEDLPSEGSFSRQSISEIRYDSKEGFWVTLVKSGIKVKMGEEQISLKSARVSQVIDYMDIHQFQARVIDANLSKKVLVRLRKDP